MAISNKFKFLKTVDFSKFSENEIFSIPQPENDDEDLQKITDKSSVHYFTSLDDQKLTLNPGIYKCTLSGCGELVFNSIEINLDKHFGGIDIQQQIIKDCETFFNKKSVFDNLKIQARRGYLFYGSPGTGKSHTINNICKTLAESNETLIIFYNTKSDVAHLSYGLRTRKLADSVKKVVVVFEDLGGGEVDPENAYRLSDTSMLSFLDGNDYSAEGRPIIMFATTNYPTNFLSNLIDRPGRFDEVIEVNPPDIEIKKNYMESLVNRNLTDEEYNALTDNHSMAHVKEAAVKHLVYNKEIKDTLKAQTEHTEKVKNNFDSVRRMGV